MSAYYLYCFIFSILIAAVYIWRWKKVNCIYIAELFIFVPIANWGYWQLFVSESLEKAILANCILYLGAALTPMLIMQSIIYLCKVFYHSWTCILAYLLPCIILGAVMTVGHNDLFYKYIALKWVNGRGFLIKEYGPLHTLFYVMIVLYFMIGLGVTIYSFRNKRDVSLKTITLLLCINLFCIAAFVLGRLYGEYELLPAAYDISLVLFLIISERFSLYDVDATVSDTMISRGEIGVASFDCKHRFLGCNDVAKRYYPAFEQLRVDEAVSPKKETLQELGAWLEELEQNRTLDLDYRRDEHYYNVTARYLYSGASVKGYHFIFRDCTEEKRYEKKLEEQTQKALEASNLKGRFLANMSHEIRTPINVVLGFNTMIQRESTEANIREYAADIDHAGQNLLAIINDILDVTKIESGKMEIVPVEYELGSLIHDVILMMSMRAQSKQLKLRLEMNEHLPSWLYGDDVRIRQILINLVGNAIKYTEKGSVVLRVDGEICDQEIFLHFEVEDTGIGIKEEALDKLFAAYERIEEMRTHNIEGTGLGIAITSQLLSLMDSELKVNSVYGKGSVFSFDLRQEIRNFTEIGDLQGRLERPEKHYEALFTAPEGSVLVVDDNLANRKVFKGLLKETGLRIEEASGGAEALRMIADTPYDIIFLDHMMPEMDGIEVRRRMLSLKDYPNLHTPVVALTANAVTGAREMYLEAGFDNFLSKPIDADKLEKMVFKYLPEEHRRSRQAEAAEDSGSREKTEELPEIEGIDWAYALFRLKDKALLFEAAKDVAWTAQKDLQELMSLYDQLADSGHTQEKEAVFEEYRIKVHSMKTEAAMIGAVSVSALARILEFSARDREQGRIEAVMDIFVKEWQLLAEHLWQSFAADKKEKTGKVIDEDLLKQYFQMLSAAMKELDTDTADAVMEELRGYSYKGKRQSDIEELSAAVQNLDVDFVQKIIHNWR